MGILKVTRPKLKYFCDEKEFINEGTFQLGTSIQVDKLDGQMENLFNVYFGFNFKIAKESVIHLDDIDDSELKYSFEVIYKVVLDTPLKKEEITKKKMLIMLRAYIEKDMADYFREIESPYIGFPEEVWDETIEL